MVDNNQINTDAEYRPKEEEYVDVPQPLGLPKQAVPGKFKRLFIVIAIIVVVFFAYNFFNWYSGQRQHVSNKNQTLAAKQPQLATQPPVVISDKTDLTKNVFDDSSMRKQLDVLSQEVESNREQLAELSNSLIQGQQAMENLNKNISNLSVSLREIGEKVQQIASKEIKPVTTVTKKVLKSNIIKKKMPVYHVKAIVPERAWLESDKGETVSVRVGDVLDDYGVVQAISPKQGIVVTSSKVIQYGNNDF